jgi:hypothetical protein
MSPFEELVAGIHTALAQLEQARSALRLARDRVDAGRAAMARVSAGSYSPITHAVTGELSAAVMRAEQTDAALSAVDRMVTQYLAAIGAGSRDQDASARPH